MHIYIYIFIYIYINNKTNQVYGSAIFQISKKTDLSDQSNSEVKNNNVFTGNMS